MNPIEDQKKSIYDIECSYCGLKYNDDEDPADPEDVCEFECECGNTFTYSYQLYREYESEKAPCLNGETPHEWKPVAGWPKNLKTATVRCTMCHREKEIENEVYDPKKCIDNVPHEWEKINATTFTCRYCSATQKYKNSNVKDKC